MTSVPDITLHNGVEIPQLGFGTYQIEPDEAVKAVLVALEAGYRHIDTAQMYGNEAQVGDALHAFDAPREEVFVTSKLNNGNHAPADVHRSFEETLDKLGLDFLDLFLIHWPLPDVGDYVDTWHAMIELAESDRVRAIGVSNFQTHHLDRLIDETDMVPVVNQIEAHPYFHNDVVRRHGHEHDIVTEAWSPIAQGDIIGDETLVEIGRAPRQVGGAGDVALAPPARGHRLPEVDDARAGRGELRRCSTSNSPQRTWPRSTRLDRGARRGPDPDEFNWIP